MSLSHCMSVISALLTQQPAFPTNACLASGKVFHAASGYGGFCYNASWRRLIFCFHDLQARLASRVSYVTPSASKQVGASTGTACLPHIVIQPPNLNSVVNAAVAQNVDCMLTQVACLSAMMSVHCQYTVSTLSVHCQYTVTMPFMYCACAVTQVFCH